MHVCWVGKCITRMRTQAKSCHGTADFVTPTEVSNYQTRLLDAFKAYFTTKQEEWHKECSSILMLNEELLHSNYRTLSV